MTSIQEKFSKGIEPMELPPTEYPTDSGFEIPNDAFPLPSGGIGNNDSAEIIFSEMGKIRKIFMRGTVAHEVATTDESDHLPQTQLSLTNQARVSPKSGSIERTEYVWAWKD